VEITSYLTVTGASQGEIEGGCVHKDHTGKIEILSFDHEISVPVVAEYHHAGGKPVHRPIVIQKEIDQATPRLYQALFRGEKLTTVEFEWYRFEKSNQKLYYKVILEGALVSGVKPHSPHVLDTDEEKFRFIESISFIYEQITWSWGESGEVLFTQQWLDEV